MECQPGSSPNSVVMFGPVPTGSLPLGALKCKESREWPLFIRDPVVFIVDAWRGPLADDDIVSVPVLK